MEAWRWLGWAALQVAGVSAECRSPGGGDCEVGMVAPAFCVLATHERSQLTEYQPGLCSDEEQHVFPNRGPLAQVHLWEAGHKL